mmetsp:Transcript_24441/g.63819  ORF Transcript_24441/g.63819 Transcript_24441/m.63819 type:complete len:203 (+) Transcript_24441:105-713(+)
MDTVIVLGATLWLCISSTSSQTARLLCCLTYASMSSLKVTQFGASPSARMAPTAARARRVSPLLRYALIIVLCVTTSAPPTAFASAMTFSAALRSPHLTQMSSSVFRRHVDRSGLASKTSVASLRRRSDPRLRTKWQRMASVCSRPHAAADAMTCRASAGVPLCTQPARRISTVRTVTSPQPCSLTRSAGSADCSRASCSSR